MAKYLFLLGLALALGSAVAACASPSTPAPTASPEATTGPVLAVPPVPSPQPTYGAPPSATLTAIPTATPTSSPPAPTPPPKATATPVPTRPVPTPAASARYGGALSLASRQNIAHQDVHQEVSPALSTWGPGIVYSRLLRFKSGSDVELPSLAVECELCESWEMEDDTTFLFRVRQGVSWQRTPPVNGRKLTAEDIVFSYDRQRQRDWPNAPLLQGIKAMAAPAPDTLRISLTAPDADFLVSLADGHSKIVAREAVEVKGDLRDGPTIGTGPWVLTGTRPNAAHTFEANPDYFERGFPFLENLVIHIIPDSVTRDAAFKTRVLDIQQMEPQEWEAFHRSRPTMPFTMAKEAGAGLEVALKSSAPPFEDVRVRRAVFQAMDPWAAIDEIWRGAAFVSLGLQPAEADWLLPDEEMRGFVGNPRRARGLLGEANAKIPAPVTIKVGDFGDLYRAHAQRIAEEMRAVGFAPTVEVVNRRVFGDGVWLGGDYQMFVGPIAPATSLNSYLLTILHSQGRWNTTGHKDEELDRLIEAQAQEWDQAARKKLVLDIQRRAMEGAYRFMPATRVAIWTWWPRVRNFHPNFAGFEYFHWARVWVEGS